MNEIQLISYICKGCSRSDSPHSYWQIKSLKPGSFQDTQEMKKSLNNNGKYKEQTGKRWFHPLTMCESGCPTYQQRGCKNIDRDFRCDQQEEM